ncbi:Transcription factor cbf11 [Leucoagaricus sp. SymC.cos]|nr:Transcription factor cbf11 [Leucoagaricus sp. SymC.cos]
MSLPQENFFLNHHLQMPAGPADSQLDSSSAHPSRSATPAQQPANLLVSGKQPTPQSTAINSPKPTPPLPAPEPASQIPAPDPNASLQSILAATKKDAIPNGQQLPPWNASNPAQLPPPNPPPPAVGPAQPTGKRKLEDAEADDPHNKIRRIVRDHVSQDPARVMPMTTVICLHAAVAQKSYGSEKRFLCPPPVVHIEGPLWHMRSQQLAMAVVSEAGERSFEQKAPLDNNMTASFKFLHVTGTAKAKSFQLSLDIAEPPPPSLPESGDTASGRIWATFDSAPVTIISKPSKKTAKTRNISSCILAGGPVSLFNRINSQTVRTKYMTIDHAQLPGAEAPSVAGGPQPVTYGSEIVLSDTHSGISTSPLIIRKVDKGRVSNDDGGPVSQMQKIALQRVSPDGSRHYLSAAGPLPGTNGVVAPPAPGMSTQAGTHPLMFQSPRIRDEVKDGQRIISDEVDDYLCWTIVGISAPGPLTNISPFVQSLPGPQGLEGVPGPSDPATGSPLSPTAPPRYMPSGPLHTIVVVEMPPLQDIIKVLEEDPLPPHPPHPHPEQQAAQQSPDGGAGASGSSGSHEGRNGNGTLQPPPPPPPPPAMAGRTLPLLFIRASDGVGYHSGRTIACENVFQGVDLNAMAANPQNGGPPMDPNWLAAAQAAAAEGGLHGWTLRVM